MPLYLDQEIVKWTIKHILKHGDTDIFPHPFEFRFFDEKADEIASAISQIDLYTYHPVNLIESLVPKSRNGFRLGHQLYSIDSIIFTAAVVTIASDLERGRIPIQENVAFSYRFDQQEDGDIFANSHRYRDWLNHSYMLTLFNDADIAHVVKTDISDFYSRIYHHRLENSLNELTGSSPFAKFILRCLSDYRAKQSFGIPVGGNATRLLAEVALIDTDNALRNEGYKHTRYVDDFLIFIKKNQDPYGALAFLAGHLAANEGLSLSPLKTRIYTAHEYKNELNLNSADDDESATSSAVAVLYEKAYANEDIDEAAVAELSALDLVGELKQEINQDHWDVNKIRIFLRALRLTKSATAIPFIKSDLRKFIPVIKDAVLLMEELVSVDPQAFTDFGDEVVKIIQEPVSQRLPVIRAWLLELYLRGIVPISATQLRELDSLKGALDLRQLCLIRMKLGDVNFFRRGKARVDELNDWQKPAFIFGASCLPRDEFETWLQNIKGRLKFPLSSLFCDWAKSTTQRGKRAPS